MKSLRSCSSKYTYFSHNCYLRTLSSTPPLIHSFTINSKHKCNTFTLISFINDIFCTKTNDQKILPLVCWESNREEIFCRYVHLTNQTQKLWNSILNHHERTACFQCTNNFVFGLEKNTQKKKIIIWHLDIEHFFSMSFSRRFSFVFLTNHYLLRFIFPLR